MRYNYNTNMLKNTNLVVLASTFPRWERDTVPSFVLDYAERMLPDVRSVTVIAPHYAGAKRRERLPSGINVRRFRYAYPYRFENIAYGQFQKTKFYPVKVLLYTVSEFWMTLRVCARNRPAIINAHWLIPQGFVAVMVKYLLHCPVIISVHGSDIFTLNGKLMKKVKRFILQRADAVVVNSSVTREACRKLYDRDYPVIPMGVDMDRFKLSKPRPTSDKSDKFEMLFVGRLAASKGVQHLIEALSTLDTQKMHLSIIGDGPERPSLEAYVHDHGLDQIVTFVGWVQPADLPEYYASADVFVGPSIEEANGRKEAFGVVFVEAAASGLPVVTTGAGGMTDIVKDKETGLIVPQRDVPALAAAIEYLRDHPAKRREMGERGREFVSANFSWSKIIGRYRVVYDDVIRTRSI